MSQRFVVGLILTSVLLSFALGYYLGERHVKKQCPVCTAIMPRYEH